MADAQAMLSAPGSPAGNPGFTPAELDVNGKGEVIGSDTFSDSIFTFTDPDGDFVANAFSSFSSGLISDGDGMRFRRSDGVLFVSDASSGGTIAAFRDTNGDNVPDVSTIFAPAPGTLDPASGISLDFDSTGNVFVVDVSGGAILTFSDSNGDLVADSSTVFSDAVPGAVALKIDSAGRVFVVDAFSGSIVVLEDTNGDLVADETTTFATGLLIRFDPSNGITFDASGNVYVINNATTILVFTDTNGDRVADGPAVTYATVVGPAAGLTFGTAPLPVVTEFEGDTEKLGTNHAKVAFAGTFTFAGTIGNLSTSTMRVDSLLDEVGGGASELVKEVSGEDLLPLPPSTQRGRNK